jgi:hypothetical protein
MADLSGLSDEQLLQLSKGNATSGVSGLSDADLLALSQRQPAPTDQRPKRSPGPMGILPYSIDENDQARFDTNAGIIGALKRAFMAPGQVLRGEIDPMSEEGQRRAMETAFMGTPTSTALRAGEKVIPGVTMRSRVTPAAPTTQELRTTASAGYDKVAEMGVDYNALAAKKFADDTIRALNEEGFIAKLGPKTHALLEELVNPPADSVVQLRSLEAFRRAVGKVAGTKNDDTEAAAANMVIRRLDEFMANVDPKTIVAGTPAAAGGGTDAAARAAEEAAALLRDSRGNSAAAFRSDRLTGIDEASKLRTAAANSGQNLGNNLRSRIATLLLDDSKTRGFSEAELTALRSVVEGTATTNTLRRVSNWLGGGGGIGQSGIAALGAAAGSSVGGIPGAMIGAGLPTALGSTSRGLANSLTARQLAKVDEMTRMRSPVYNALLRDAPFADTPEARLAMLRAFLAAQGPQSQILPSYFSGQTQ